MSEISDIVDRYAYSEIISVTPLGLVLRKPDHYELRCNIRADRLGSSDVYTPRLLRAGLLRKAEEMLTALDLAGWYLCDSLSMFFTGAISPPTVTIDLKKLFKPPEQYRIGLEVNATVRRKTWGEQR